jgi:hypothetical protein
VSRQLSESFPFLRIRCPLSLIRNQLSTGVITGVVVGRIAVVVIVILASLLICFHRRRHHAKPWASSRSRGFRRRFSWQSLDSSKYGLGSGVGEGTATTTRSSAPELNHDTQAYKDGVSQEKLVSPRFPPSARLFDRVTSPPVSQFGERFSRNRRGTSQNSNVLHSSSLDDSFWTLITMPSQPTRLPSLYFIFFMWIYFCVVVICIWGHSDGE